MSARWRTQATAAVTVLVLAALVGADEPTTRPAAATQSQAQAAPTTQPASPQAAPAPTTRPALKARAPRPKAPAVEAANVRFQFKGENYSDVIRYFASTIAKKPVLGDLNAVQGKLIYFDAKPYTYTEAMGIINLVLRTAGYNLVDAGRYLELVPVNRMAQHPKLPLVLKGEFDEARRPGEEIVTTILPLQFIAADQAVAVVARMVHSFGTLSALASGKGMIITDTVANIRRIQRLLAAIDTGALAEQQLKYYGLKNAPAPEVGRLIEQLFRQSQQGRRRLVWRAARNRYEPAPPDPSDAVTVTADARSNTIVVIASAENHSMIEEIIAKVDVEEPTGAGMVRIFVLKKAKPSDMARTLTAAVGTKTISTTDNRGRTVTRQIPAARIVADDSTSRVVVSAEPDVVKQIDALVKELDGAATEGKGLRIFPLQVANAASLVNIIQNTFAVRDPRGRMQLTFAVTAEPRTNSLVVRGPAAEMDAVANLIQEFDKQTATEREFHVVRLQAGDAREMARALTNLLSQQRDPRRRGPSDSPIRIEADRGTNCLMISAAPGDWEQIKSLLAKVTEEVPAATASTRIFKLKHAKAAEVAGTLGRIFTPRRQVRRGQPQPVQAVITHDAQSNAMIVSATGDDLAEIEDLLKGLDLPPEVAAQIQVRNYTLTRASAAELARSLSRLFATQRARGRGTAEQIEPRFEAQQTSNQLVVAATAEQFETIDKLIQKIQSEAAGSETVVKLFPLKHAKADQLAPALSQVVQAEIAAEQRREASRQRRADFQVSVDARTNSLLVTAPQETMLIIEQLVPKLDVADVTVQVTKVLELTNADPNELAAAINAALAGQAPPSRGRGRQVSLGGLAGKKVIVVPEQSARAVLLTGVEEDVQLAEQLIQKIDARPSTEKPTVETIKLKHADVEDIAGVLNATVGQMARGRGAVPTRISPDKNANALVISAAADVIERIRELLTQLDVEGAKDSAITVQIVKLVNAKAAELADALNAAQGVDPRQRGRGAAEQEVVRVTADAAANALLLTGRPAQIEETRTLIAELDKAAAELTSEMRIFRLTRAKAVDMVTVLERILLGQAGGRGRRGMPAAPEVRIAAQEKANAVVVQGPPEAIAMADQIIRQFDGEFGAEVVIQIVPLTRAEASTLADAVNQALAGQAAGARGRQPAVIDAAQVVPETNSNSLLVRGTKVQVQEAVELIRRLDKGGAGLAAQVRVFKLKHAEALQASRTIELLFRQIVQQQQRRRARNAPPPPTFSIAPDERTNSLVISTSEANLVIVETLLTKLDEDAAGPLREVQYLPLLRADASTVVGKIEAMFADRRKTERPVVEADELSNGVTVIAKEADFRAVETMVAKWDEAAEANYVRVKVIPLPKQVAAEKMARMLKDLYEQVSGSEVKLTEKLPARPLVTGGERLFILPAPAEPGQKAEAPTTQPAGGAAMQAKQPTTAAAYDPPPIILAVDEGSNSLVVSASRKDLEEIDSLIWELTSTAALSEAELRVFPVKAADPVALAKTLNALFNPRQPAQAARPRQQQQQRGRQPQPPAAPKPTVVITADARTRNIIARAKPTELDAIEKLITELDRAATVTSEVRVIPLKNTDATEVARNLRELFAMTVPAGARNVRDPNAQELIKRMLAIREAEGGLVDVSAGVSISANRMTNAVIVAAPADAMKLIQDLIMQLDQSPAAAATAVKLFPVAHAEVDDVVAAVTQIFGPRRAAGARGQAARTAGAVAAGNQATKTVIVSARVDEFPLIEKVIKQLDAPAAAETNIVRVYPLEQGDASSVAQALSQSLTRAAVAQRGRRGQAQPSEGLRISPEPTSNAIVVRASAEEHDQIAKLIAELDKSPAQQATFQTIALRRADARDVANALSRMLRSWPRKRGQPAPAVGYDAKSNTLMISAQKEDMERVAAMLAKLEAGAQEKVRAQLITLRNARAFELAGELSAFYGPRAQNADPADRTVTIVADERTNSLLISAGTAQLVAIAALVEKLDVSEPAGGGKMVVIPLAYAQATNVAWAITRAFAPQKGQRVSPADLVVASPEQSTNALIVSASEANLEKIRALIKELDRETTGARKIEFIRLANAKATDLAKTLSQVVSRQRRAGGEEPPTVSAEPSSNVLVLAGKKADLTTLMDMAKQLDQVVEGKAAGAYVLPLKNSDAIEMAAMITQLYQAQAREARRAGQSVEPVAVSADIRANALIIAASEEQKNAIEKLVNQIDEMSTARGKVQWIQLKDAKPEDVLKAIEQLYGSGANGQVGRRPPARAGGQAAGRGSRPDVAVAAGQRGLFITASKEDYQAIRELIDAMEAAAAKERPEVLLFPLASASNARVAAALNSMYARAVRPGHPEDAVSVTALAGTNAVVVAAAKEKMEEVSALIRQLDKIDVAGKAEYRLFTLTRAKATKILPLLNQMLQPMRQMRPTQPISVIADATTNTIVVATQAPVLTEIERLIKTLDAVPAFEAAEVKVIPLKNAEATVLADVLTDMLTPGTSRIQSPEAKALQEQIRLLRLVKGKEGLPALDLSKPIKVTADPLRRGEPGSNSLILSSTAANLEALTEIVTLLDITPIAKGVKVEIIHLKNADATSVTALLREIFTQGRQLAQRPVSGTPGRAKPEGTAGEALTSVLNVTADSRTNGLILAGGPETVDLAMQIVKDLDRQPTSEFTEVKLFKLAHADAADLARLIDAVFAEQPTGVAGVEGAKAYVTRLRMLREKQQPVESKVARSHATVVAQAEPKANILIVAARSDLLPVIAEMVQTMDIPGAGSMNVVRIYPLKNADASRMAQVINGLYTGPNANLVRDKDKPTITVDTRTNSLVVTTSEKSFAVIDALLGKLDAKLPIELRDIRLLPLKNADAATLAPTLQQMMDARVQRQVSLGVKDAEALRMIVIPDARSNFLIVGGSAEGFELIADLAKQLDAAAPALSGLIQILPLSNANSGTLSATLTNLFNQRYAAARTPDVARQRPVIVPDLRTNSLMIAANQDDSNIIKGLVARLDAKPVSPAVELVVLPLKFNDAGAVGPMIQRIFADRLRSMTPPTQQPAPQDIVSVATDALSNALVVSASKENLLYIRALLQKVDVEPPTDTGVVKMYPLRHADVTRVESMLKNLLTQGLYKPGLVGAADNAIAQAREKVAITSDVRINVLIVSASKENFAVIDEIMRHVDVKEGWGLAGNINVYILKHADASRLGPILQQMFDRKRAAEAATGGQPRSLPVVVIPDERTNTLLVAGSQEAFQAVDALIKKLDVSEVVKTYDFKVFPLKQASATTLESTLRDLFARRPVPAGRAAQPVTILADPKLNVLIIGAAKDDLVMAEALIGKLDTPPPPAGQVVRAFGVVKADAAQLAQTLQRLYQAQGGTRPTGIAISVDERSNTILVSAAPGDMDNIADLVKKLDTAPLTDVTEIRIFTLRHADAGQLATILTDALTNKPRLVTPESANRATLLQFIAELPDGKKLIESAVKRGVMITAVPRTNSLLVQAPVETMPMLGKLIRALDQTDPRMAEIRVFPLKNADATQMARVLGELFQLTVGATQRQAATYSVSSEQPGQADAAAQPGPSAMLGSAEQNALNVTVDLRTNSLLVAGTREYVELVGRVIEQLDASPAEDRQTVVYRLRNAQAADIETALRQFLDQERQRVVSTLGANAVGAAKELLAREVAIQAEATSNTLLISGSPRFFKTIAEMVHQLDQPPPQVLIQVLLAEVTLDDKTEFGVEWSLIGRPRGRTAGGGTSFGLKGDGLNFAVSSGDFDLLLRALQNQGRLEVLSAPRIVAADNQQAEVNVGQEVPYVTSSRVTEGGSAYNTYTHRPVGIILNVTPRINPDGFVRLEVHPEISSLSESTVQISEDLNAPIFNRRFAQTTVTVQDGHTIVIGGLITKKEESREEKVPLLGDIPLLGALFKSTKITQERTELLIVLTPRVLRRPTDADVLTNKMIRQLGLSQGIHTDAPIGELLNPLQGVTPEEVKRLESGRLPLRSVSGSDPVIIPLRAAGKELEAPPGGSEAEKSK